jgi:hypothetical protein
MKPASEEQKPTLYTARWTANKIKSISTDEKVDRLADDLIQMISDLLAEPVPDEAKPQQPDRPNIEPTDPVFKVVKGKKFTSRGKYSTKSGMFSGLTIHYTVSGNAPTGVVGWLADQGYGCMVMDYDGVIWIPEGFDVLQHWGHHSGVSKWNGRSSVSDVFAGMEICCWGLSSKVGPFRTVTTKEGYVVAGKYQAYTEAQEKSLINFCMWAKKHNPEFSLDNVVGHDELRKEAGKLGDKQDPGGSLSMPMTKFRELLKKEYVQLTKWKL